MVGNKRALRPAIRALKVAIWVILALLLVFILFIWLLRLPAVQNKLTQKAISYLEQKIGTPVSLKKIYIQFPKKVVVEGLYLADQSGDTLLFAGKIGVDTDLWGLTKNRIQLNTVSLSNTVANISRSKQDGAYNFDYIINAFAAVDTPADTTSSSWEFSLGQLELTGIRAGFHDLYGGNVIDLNLGNLSLEVDEFDLSKAIYKIANLSIADTQLAVSILPIYTSSDSSQASFHDTPFPFDIDFDEIKLENIKINYDHQVAGQRLTGILGELTITSKLIDIKSKIINIDNIVLKESFVSYHQANRDEHEAKESSDVGENKLSLKVPWSINLGEMQLVNDAFQYDNNNMAPAHNGIDFNHLWVFDVQSTVKNVVFKNEIAKMQLSNLTFREKKGFALQSLAFEVSLTNQQFVLEGLKMNTTNSKIALNASATFESIDEAIYNYENVTFSLDVQKSTFEIQDVKLFAAEAFDSLAIQFPMKSKVFLDTYITGSLGDLTIKDLNIRAFDSTRIALNGTIAGLPVIKQARGAISIKEIYTTRDDIKKMLPDSLQSFALRTPSWLSLSGDIKGSHSRQAGNVTIKTSNGTANIKGGYESAGDKYDAEIVLDKLNLGALLEQSQMGPLSMHAIIEGSGLEIDSLNTRIDATINELLYNDYLYRDFKINGSVVKRLFSGSASIDDDNLDFDLKGEFDYSEDTPAYTFIFNLRNANFQNLNFSARPLRARATVDAKIALETKSINGDISIRNVGIYNGEALYTVDSLLVVSIDQDTESTLSIRSDIIAGNFKGSFSLLGLPKALKQQINRYFTLYEGVQTPSASPQNFKFDLSIRDTDLLTEIIFPDLQPFVPGRIEGEFDSESNRLTLNMELTKIKYATTSIDSIALNIEGDERELNYRFRLKNVSMDSLRIDALQLSGVLANDSLQSGFYVLDSEDEKKYEFGGVMSRLDGAYRFHFNKDQVMLNYNLWQVPADNYLQFGNNNVITNNFSLANEEQKISIIASESDSSFVFKFDQFELSNFTKIVSGVVTASGLLVGELRFTTARRGEFRSNLKIEQFSVLEKNWGNADIALSHTSDLYDAKISLQGKNLNLKAEGNYNTKPPTAEFNLNLEFDPLDLSVIEPLTLGQLKNLKGFANGNMKISGSLNQPVIRGEVTFSDASFLSTYLNNNFTLTKERISFLESGIAFNNFVIRDEKNNEATIKGEIKTESYNKFDFRLKVNTNNFQVLNTTLKDNSLFYGLLKINADATIIGTSVAPKVKVSLSISDDSNLTYVVPQSEKDALQEKGIVQFVDKDAKNDPFLANLPITVSTGNKYTGIDLTADVTLKDESSLHIVIDPITGDKLSVYGNAILILSMNPSGNMNLSGRYEITKGTYNFSFHNVIKREFDIEKGSSIVWSGDPFNASMNIRATYTVEASPLDLVYNQINSTNQEEINSYSQRLSFLVNLLIQGKLLEPEIRFKLDMPDDERNAMGGAIYAKLQDINSRESDLSKQVFALLILKRFISDNPLESQSRTGLSNTARLSVSRILSDQLNRLSENIKGVELSFDVKSYESYNGTEVQGDTKVQLGVSKSLFDERLVVKVSGNVDVEGGETNSNATDYIGDIALEYKLTSDGRFRITGFRNSNFDMIDGELTETGVGLIYIKDYNTLRELFKSNAKKN